MKQPAYKQFITTSGNFQVILEYPREPEEEEATRKEVRQTLNRLLREQLTGERNGSLLWKPDRPRKE